MIQLISHEEFGALRLAGFVPAESDISEPADWEYMSYLWVRASIVGRIGLPLRGGMGAGEIHALLGSPSGAFSF